MKRPLLLVSCLLLAACASGTPAPASPASQSDDRDTEESGSESGSESGADSADRQPAPAPAPDSSADCVPEGGTAYTLSDRQCCPGLQFLLQTGPANDGQCIAPPPGPSPGLCVSTCGNGVCEGPENECNCTDCD